ncbi:hypothetical protein [Candidatus Frankia alpina]|uniref:hypothetical protein n=1 Tax=Candidatus Frankia alpina TaxID=2699483 RepID=UPI001F412E41|nr:hypothetical protein [Candidatus Frankia alpina]
MATVAAVGGGYLFWWGSAFAMPGLRDGLGPHYHLAAVTPVLILAADGARRLWSAAAALPRAAVLRPAAAGVAAVAMVLLTASAVPGKVDGQRWVNDRNAFLAALLPDTYPALAVVVVTPQVPSRYTQVPYQTLRNRPDLSGGRAVRGRPRPRDGDPARPGAGAGAVPAAPGRDRRPGGARQLLRVLHRSASGQRRADRGAPDRPPARRRRGGRVRLRAARRGHPDLSGDAPRRAPHRGDDRGHRRGAGRRRRDRRRRGDAAGGARRRARPADRRGPRPLGGTYPAGPPPAH